MTCRTSPPEVAVTRGMRRRGWQVLGRSAGLVRRGSLSPGVSGRRGDTWETRWVAGRPTGRALRGSLSLGLSSRCGDARGMQWVPGRPAGRTPGGHCHLGNGAGAATPRDAAGPGLPAGRVRQGSLSRGGWRVPGPSAGRVRRGSLSPGVSGRRGDTRETRWVPGHPAGRTPGVAVTRGTGQARRHPDTRWFLGCLQDESARGRCHPGDAAAGMAGPRSLRWTSSQRFVVTRGKRQARRHPGDAVGSGSPRRTSPSWVAVTRGKRQARRHPETWRVPSRLQDESARGRCHPRNAAAGVAGPGSLRRTSPSVIAVTRDKRQARPVLGSPRSMCPPKVAVTWRTGRRLPGRPAGRVRRRSLSLGVRGRRGDTQRRGGSRVAPQDESARVAVIRGTRRQGSGSRVAPQDEPTEGRCHRGGGGRGGSRVAPRDEPAGGSLSPGTHVRSLRGVQLLVVEEVDHPGEGLPADAALEGPLPTGGLAAARGLAAA